MFGAILGSGFESGKSGAKQCQPFFVSPIVSMYGNRR